MPIKRKAGWTPWTNTTPTPSCWSSATRATWRPSAPCRARRRRSSPPRRASRSSRPVPRTRPTSPRPSCRWPRRPLSAACRWWRRWGAAWTSTSRAQPCSRPRVAVAAADRIKPILIFAILFCYILLDFDFRTKWLNRLFLVFLLQKSITIANLQFLVRDTLGSKTINIIKFLVITI